MSGTGFKMLSEIPASYVGMLGIGILLYFFLTRVFCCLVPWETAMMMEVFGSLLPTWDTWI